MGGLKMASVVYVLGAGFSRAISGEMPTMDHLSSEVKQAVRASRLPKIPGADTPLANNFEQWLSYLVETPPWLSESHQARNRAGFSDVARAVHSVLSDCQKRAVQNGEPPEWLQPLMVYWEENAATVITFNYDLFVELAWLRSFSDGDRRLRRSLYLYPVPITPIGTRLGYPIGGIPTADGLRLLKLHGSLSWRYSGQGSTPGDVIYDLGVFGSGWDVDGIGPVQFGNGRPDADELSVDREPMIVPPAAVKSPYYNNRTLQELWRLAADALSKAEELVIMGFSLPQTDLLVGSMLVTTLPKRSKITPVNRNAGIVDLVLETFQISAKSRRVDRSFVGLENPIAAWVDAKTGQ
jgi:hypothetical protein